MSRITHRDGQHVDKFGTKITQGAILMDCHGNKFELQGDGKWIEGDGPVVCVYCKDGNFLLNPTNTLKVVKPSSPKVHLGFIFFGVCALMMFCVLLANSSAGPRPHPIIQSVEINK